MRTLLLLACMLALSNGWTGTVSADEAVQISAVQLAGRVPPRPGRWWHFFVSVTNPTNQREEVRVVASLPGSNAEFAAATSIAPRSTQRIEVPVHFPASLAPGSGVTIEVSARVVQEGKEVLARGTSDTVVETIDIRLSEERVVTAVITEPPPPSQPGWLLSHVPYHQTYEFALALREADGLSRQMVLFDAEPLPTSVTQWDAIDGLVLADDALLASPEAVAALRRWLLEGGHLMVALEKVDPQSVAPLLGDYWHGEVVDRVALSTFEMETSLLPDLADAARVELGDDPVSMVRIVSHGGEVTHRIDGWPAAIRFPVGQGEVWLTTVGSDAWMHSDAYSGTGAKTAFEFYPWTMPIVPHLLAPRETVSAPFLTPTAAASFVDYPVPSRWLVAGCLLGFLVTLGGAWFALNRRGNSQRIAWLVPLFACLASAPLLLGARSQQPEIPDTLAAVQFAQLEPGGGRALLQQQAMAYLGQGKSVEASLDGGIAMPDASQLQAPFRVTEAAFDQRRLEVDNWPRGLRPVTLRTEVPIDEAWAVGRFDAAGLTIRFPDSLPGAVSDATFLDRLAYFHSTVSVGEREFLIAAPRLGNAVPDSETLVADRSRQHRAVFQSLDGSDFARRFADQQSVFCWTAAWPQSESVEQLFKTTGEALNQIPLRYTRPAAGETIVLPAAVNVLQPSGDTLALSGVFQQLTGQKSVPLTKGAAVQLRWRLPAEVLPLQIEEAYFSAEAIAPGRTVTVAGRDGDGSVAWVTAENPDGEIGSRIGGDQLVLDAAKGTIEFTLSVSELATAPAAASEGDAVSTDDNTWSVSELQLEIKATHGGAAGSDATPANVVENEVSE